MPNSSHPAAAATDRWPGSLSSIAVRLIRAAAQRNYTVAVAESLTGGSLAAALVEPAGSSAVFRGGVVAYATDLKAQLLGVDPDRLHRFGPVDARVAAQMAQGVAMRLGADFGIATTGVAGPATQGQPVGTVFIACANILGEQSKSFENDPSAAPDSGPATVVVRRYDLPGSRSKVRQVTVDLACALGLGMIGEQN